MHAAEPGKLLRGCTCVAVPFAGGMCEVPFILSPKGGDMAEWPDDLRVRQMPTVANTPSIT